MFGSLQTNLGTNSTNILITFQRIQIKRSYGKSCLIIFQIMLSATYCDQIPFARHYSRLLYEYSQYFYQLAEITLVQSQKSLRNQNSLKKYCFFKIWEGALYFCVLFKQWPLAPNSRDSRVTRANVSRRVTFFSKTRQRRVGESGESAQHGVASVGESGESAQHGSANVGESGESVRHVSANVGEFGESARHGSAQARMIR